MRTAVRSVGEMTAILLGASVFLSCIPFANAAENPAKPYVFSLGGTTAEETATIKDTPGFPEVAVEPSGRTRVVWDPAVRQSQKDSARSEQALYDLLAIRRCIGETKYTHGGWTSNRAGSVVVAQKSAFHMFFAFEDGNGGGNESVSLMGYSEAVPGQVEHEMLRGFVGTPVTAEKCGDGYVLVSRSFRGVAVVWQVSEQMFVRIDNCYPKELVAAYVGRLGSIIPKDYQPNLDKWIVNEIRWRCAAIDYAFKYDEEKKTGVYLVWYYWAPLQATFPEIPVKQKELRRGVPLAGVFDRFAQVRSWLWANRDSFRYDDPKRAFLLKGADKYDPKNPPELPEELRGPPPPAPDPPQDEPKPEKQEEKK